MMDSPLATPGEKLFDTALTLQEDTLALLLALPTSHALIDGSGSICVANAAWSQCVQRMGVAAAAHSGEQPRRARLHDLFAASSPAQQGLAVLLARLLQGEISEGALTGALGSRSVNLHLAVMQSGSLPVLLATLSEGRCQQSASTQRCAALPRLDPLTGLCTRAELLARLSQAMLAMSAGERPLVALLFLDLNRFKDVNEMHGHRVGDEVLVAVAERLARCTRREDCIARSGGDEFAILLSDVASADAVDALAERIHQTFASPFVVEDRELLVSTTIGIVVSAQCYARAEDVLRDAETALHRARAQQERQLVFQEPMHHQLVERLQLESDIRHALRRNEFCLYYQPIVPLNAQGLPGLEALLRWCHPARGLLAPADFVALAEETGLICELGAWVIKTACAQLQAWQRAGLPRFQLAINLSALQLKGREICNIVADAIEQSAIDPGLLVFELTETSVLAQKEQTIAVLRALKQLGVQIAIDDFGTGYSSLAHVREFPIDMVKIDRVFVMDLPGARDAATITSGILQIARHLGLLVIAEGVETPDQLAMLRAYQCDAVQGYLLSQPVPPQSVPALVAAGLLGRPLVLPQPGALLCSA